MSLYLYNTLTRKKTEFKPLTKGKVGLYTCGPTVYAPAHIGNLRTYIFEDVLKRTLLFNDFKVKHVMNITDVGHLTSDADDGEDKMEKGSRTSGQTVWQLAEQYTNLFKQNLKDLNILEPTIWCQATDHIKEQIQLIKQLEDKGFTYKTSDGLYYDTSKFSHYHELARLNLSGQKQGTRLVINKEKKNPTDFALWKFSSQKQQRQMEWPSPWGVGFPGWHIECSAMSMKYLGKTFDIHCGGIDHIPVHHTNEIAQSQAATNKPPANWWLHGEFLVINEQRMGKSEGNLLTLTTLIERNISPLAYRYFTYSAHYRSQLNLSFTALESAQKTLNNLQAKVAMLKGKPAVGCAEFEKKFQEAVNDDLNMPQALAIVWQMLKSDLPDKAKRKSINLFDTILGLGLKDIETISIPKQIDKLIAERETARQQKNWPRADDLREVIKNQGFYLEDTEAGPVVKLNK
ncbi:cysteine--tRNA ligase [Patescibacteria group bacterium]|nr:cysteine--tRNA ligase [Patescibacteria group bacterium]